MELLQAYINYGALGLMVIVLLLGIRTLYKRNVVVSDRIAETLSKNTSAFEAHAKAIDNLTGVIKNCPSNKS